MRKCVDCESDSVGRSPRCTSCKKAQKRLTCREAAATWRARHPEKLAAQARLPSMKIYNDEYRAKNKDECNKRVAEWAKKNTDRKRRNNEIWRQKNLERRTETNRKWSIANRDKECARAARYRAAKMQACPAWADLKEIGRIYAEAQRISRETGIPHHVDHIYPLQSKWVCGLHVPLNLQIIPGSENMSKSNLVWPGSTEMVDSRNQRAHHVDN
jgi:hypothetical protein